MDNTIAIENLNKAVKRLIDKGPSLKYSEMDILADIINYVAGTYSEHYTNDQTDIQGFDVWNARGSLCDTSIDNAIKYQMRYGKKSGYNRKDLMKPIHYLILALYAHDNRQEKSTPIDGNEKAARDLALKIREVARTSNPGDKITKSSDPLSIWVNPDHSFHHSFQHPFNPAVDVPQFGIEPSPKFTGAYTTTSNNTSTGTIAAGLNDIKENK